MSFKKYKCNIFNIAIIYTSIILCALTGNVLAITCGDSGGDNIQGCVFVRNSTSSTFRVDVLDQNCTDNTYNRFAGQHLNANGGTMEQTLGVNTGDGCDALSVDDWNGTYIVLGFMNIDNPESQYYIGTAKIHEFTGNLSNSFFDTSTNNEVSPYVINCDDDPGEVFCEIE